MASGVDKLLAEVERLPLDTALRSAVLNGVRNTDPATAEREAEELRQVLDGIPSKLRAVRESIRRDVVVADDKRLCPTCGQPAYGGLEQFFVRLGITDEMIGNLKGQFQNVDVDEYLNTARNFLKDGSGRASTYAKENPGKVAAGIAALALGAGLLYAAANRENDD
jgi:hypothetical protein